MQQHFDNHLRTGKWFLLCCTSTDCNHLVPWRLPHRNDMFLEKYEQSRCATLKNIFYLQICTHLEVASCSPCRRHTNSHQWCVERTCRQPSHLCICNHCNHLWWLSWESKIKTVGHWCKIYVPGFVGALVQDTLGANVDIQVFAQRFLTPHQDMSAADQAGLRTRIKQEHWNCNDCLHRIHSRHCTIYAADI